VVGICNGFQVLTEAGMLPGALQKNRGLKFLCTTVELPVETTRSALTNQAAVGQVLRVPVNHFEGNYTCSPETLASFETRIGWSCAMWRTPMGPPMTSRGITNEGRATLVGLMPHPERAISDLLGPPTSSCCSRACCAPRRAHLPEGRPPTTTAGEPHQWAAVVGDRPDQRAAREIPALLQHGGVDAALAPGWRR